MRSATPKVMHKVARRADARPRDPRGAGGGRGPHGGGGRAGCRRRSRPLSARRRRRRRCMCRPSGSGRRMRCSRRGRRSRRRRTTSIVLYGDTPLITAATLKALRADAREGRPRRARLHAGRPGRLRAAPHRGQAAHRDPRGEGREPGGAGGPALQCRGHGVPRRAAADAPEDRQHERQGRILPDRPRRARQRARRRRSRCSRPTPTRWSASTTARELAAAEALFQRGARRGGDGRRRDADRAGDGVLLATTRSSAAT